MFVRVSQGRTAGFKPGSFWVQFPLIHHSGPRRDCVRGLIASSEVRKSPCFGAVFSELPYAADRVAKGKEFSTGSC